MLMRDLAPLGLRLRATRAEDEPGMREAFARGRVDAVITDHNLPRFDSFAALKVAKSVDDDLPVIVLSARWPMILRWPHCKPAPMTSFSSRACFAWCRHSSAP